MEHGRPEARRGVRLAARGALADPRRHRPVQPRRRSLEDRRPAPGRRGRRALPRRHHPGRIPGRVRRAACRVRRERAIQVPPRAAPGARPLDRDAVRAAAAGRRHRGHALAAHPSQVRPVRADRAPERPAHAAHLRPGDRPDRFRSAQRRTDRDRRPGHASRTERVRARGGGAAHRRRAGASPARRGADRARAQRSRRRRLSHPSLRAGRFLAGAAPGGAGGLPAGGRRGAARAVLGPGLPELPDGRGPDCFPGGPAGRQPLPAVRSLLRPRAGQDRRGDLPAASAGARRRRRTLLHQRTGAHSSRGRAGAAARGIRGQAARAAPGGPAAALRPRRSHGERGGARRRPPGGPRQRRAEKSRRPRWSSGRAESSRCAARFLRSRT